MNKELIAVKKAVRKKNPLIHCLTNHITSYACANSILAIGAQPIMAEHPDEVAGITAGANGLLLNLGNISDTRMAAMQKSAAVATKKKIPIVLDAVGVSCSQLRLHFAQELLERYAICVVKGNHAEITALLTGTCTARGVDADPTRMLPEETIFNFAQVQQCTVLASGAVDVVIDGKQVAYIKNGHPLLGRITGTGCVLGALTTTFCSGADPFVACLTGAIVLGIAGEKAANNTSAIGTGSFAIALQDQLYSLSNDVLLQESKYTVKEFSYEKTT